MVVMKFEPVLQHRPFSFGEGIGGTEPSSEQEVE